MARGQWGRGGGQSRVQGDRFIAAREGGQLCALGLAPSLLLTCCMRCGLQGIVLVYGAHINTHTPASLFLYMQMFCLPYNINKVWNVGNSSVYRRGIDQRMSPSSLKPVHPFLSIAQLNP